MMLRYSRSRNKGLPNRMMILNQDAIGVCQADTPAFILYYKALNLPDRLTVTELLLATSFPNDGKLMIRCKLKAVRLCTSCQAIVNYNILPVEQILYAKFACESRSS